jgi:hypothetical protein
MYESMDACRTSQMTRPSRHLLAYLNIDVSLISDGDNGRTKSKTLDIAIIRVA